VLAVLLASIGLYGVMSYTVAQRRREIGLRMALGADRGRVLTMVLREATVLVAVGSTAGTALALLAGRSAESLLFGLSPTDLIHDGYRSCRASHRRGVRDSDSRLAGGDGGPDGHLAGGLTPALAASASRRSPTINADPDRLCAPGATVVI
jgi:ABC-type antimicrobial peptide transport system permease subunit